MPLCSRIPTATVSLVIRSLGLWAYPSTPPAGHQLLLLAGAIPRSFARSYTLPSLACFILHVHVSHLSAKSGYHPCRANVIHALIAAGHPHLPPRINRVITRSSKPSYHRLVYAHLLLGSSRLSPLDPTHALHHSAACRLPCHCQFPYFPRRVPVYLPFIP